MPLPEYSFEAMLAAVDIGERQFYRMAEEAGITDVGKRRFTEQEVQKMIEYRARTKNMKHGAKIRITRMRNRGGL